MEDQGILTGHKSTNPVPSNDATWISVIRIFFPFVQLEVFSSCSAYSAPC